MEHQRDNEGLIFIDDNAVIDEFFAVWWEEYRKQHSSNVDDFKEVFHRAFIEGWLACEHFYEETSDVIVGIPMISMMVDLEKPKPN